MRLRFTTDVLEQALDEVPLPAERCQLEVPLEYRGCLSLATQPLQQDQALDVQRLRYVGSTDRASSTCERPTRGLPAGNNSSPRLA